MKRWFTSFIQCLLIALAYLMIQYASAQDETLPSGILSDRDRQVRERYETVLMNNPFQERAFDQVYDIYLNVEGVDAWIEKLKPMTEAVPPDPSACLILGQIYDRQFRSPEALRMFEKALGDGEMDPQFQLLMGTLYYKAGQDEKAIGYLAGSLDGLADLERRASVCRMLGNVYLRAGKRDEAVKTWERIVERNPEEIFSLIELAEIYEDNRLWDKAIDAYRRIADLSDDDPYRRCRSLRSIGQCHLNNEKYQDAIASFEKALELVAPGNWLFEDLKLRLVGVYQDLGDLEALSAYILAKLERAPNDLEFRDLLAETYSRMNQHEKAEAEYQYILERDPRKAMAFEKMITLYSKTGQTEKETGAFEKLIELYPNESDYHRRMGEMHLRNGDPDQAKAAWRRWAEREDSPSRWAELAGWLEGYDFGDEAADAYEKALAGEPNKEWRFRLAALMFERGDEEEALQQWLSTLDAEASAAADYAEVASILEMNQFTAQAMDLQKTAIEKEPENLDFRLAYAKNLMREEEYENALREFDVLAGQHENDYFREQGESGRLDVYAEQGVLEEKQKEWEMELDANPDSPEHLTKLARLYERSGQREKAVTLYERRVELQPNNPDFLRSMAEVYKASKMTEEAIDLYKELIDADKNRARVYYKSLLDIYLSIDLKDEAINAAKKIIELAPADPEARLQLAQAHEMYRQPEEALRQYRYALRLEPNEADYHRSYGEALAREKRWGEAQEAFRKMLDAAQEDATRLSAVENLARIYLQQDLLDELRDEFLRRARNTPKKLAAYSELAAVHKEAGQIFRSVEVLENALEEVDDKSEALKALIRFSYEAQDFVRVRNYYEQLLAMSGQPSAFEYERLGKIYAQLGDINQAKETWGKIVEASPDDAKAFDQLAKIYQDEGFSEEALAVKARSVELDAFDFKRRFEYAQMLASLEQPVKAMEQLQLILDIGEKQEPDPKDKKSKEKKVQPLQSGLGSSVISPYQFMYGGRGISSSWRGSFRGSFDEMRPQLILFMAQMAQNSIGQDAFVESFQEKIKANPNNTDALRDLMLVYLSFNQIESAMESGEKILQAAPDDVDIMQQLALAYAQQQELDKAIPLMERLAETQPKLRKLAAQALVPLYFQNKEEDKAMALAGELMKESQNDIQVVYTMGNMMQQQGKSDLAIQYYEKGKGIDPRYDRTLSFQIAQIKQQAGNTDEALIDYTKLLMTDDPNAAAARARQKNDVYKPVVQVANRGMGGYGMAMGMYGMGGVSLPSQIMGNVDYIKRNALQQIMQLKHQNNEEADAMERLEQQARAYPGLISAEERSRAWDAAKMIVGIKLGKKEYDASLELLDVFRQAGKEDMEMLNLLIYIKELQKDYAEMLKLYGEMEKAFPAKSREIAMAKANAALLSDDIDTAVGYIRDLSQQRLPPKDYTLLIQQLDAIGERGRAKELLEEHLESASRNSEALSVLARWNAEESDYEKAIELASEAWDRQAHGRGRVSYYSSGMYYVGGMGGGGNLLNELHNYYVAAGRSDELIRQFEERLEKQPGSVQLYENLAQLHRMGNNRDKAIEVYERLSAARPHLLSAKTNVASLYREKGQFNKAKELYEELLKANPNAYQRISWQLRDLYQRMGKGEELQEIEETMAKKATDPWEMANLARQYQQSGDYGKAEEMMEKAIKMQPMDSYMYNQLAEIQASAGCYDEALKTYKRFLDSPMVRTQSYVDHNALGKMVALYNATGRIDELKQNNQAALEENENDNIAKAIQGHIVKWETNFDEALKYYEQTMKTARDPNVLNELIEIAEIRGKPDEILEMIENSSQFNQFWDHPRLARLYIAKGDREKAAEMLNQYVERQQQYGGGGGYEIREALNNFIQFGLYEEAEAFIKKHRTTMMDDYVTNEMDEQIANLYVWDHKFSYLVDEVLAKDSIKGRDLDLIKKIAQRHAQDGRPEKQTELLNHVLEKNPKNNDLAMEIANIHLQSAETAHAVPVLERLVAEQPNKLDYWEKYANALIQADQAGAAIEKLRRWCEEKPLAERYQLLARIQISAGFYKDAMASLEKALERADSSKKAEARLEIARLAADHGGGEDAAAAMKAYFDERSDANAFQQYLQFLRSNGLDESAYQFFMENKDAGYLDRYRNQDLVALSLSQSDFETPVDLAWKFGRFSSRWDQDYFTSRVIREYEARGKMERFTELLSEKIANETPVSAPMEMALGDAYSRASYASKALDLYTKLWDGNPLNRDLTKKRADLLLRLKRDDEGIELYRNIKGAMSIPEKIDDEIALAEVLFKAKKPNEAEAVINELLAWSEGGATLFKAAQVYMSQKMYDKAFPLYKGARNMLRDHNYGQLLQNLGKCHAKAGQIEEAAAVWEEAASQRYVGSFLNGLHDWLVEEKLYDAASAALDFRLKRSPADFQAHLDRADLFLKQGQLAELFLSVNRAYENAIENNKAEALSKAANFLAANKQTLGYVESGHALPELMAMTLGGLSAKNDKNLIELIAARLADFQTDVPELQLAIANGFEKIERMKDAAAWHAQAAKNRASDSAQVLAGGAGLMKCGDQEGARIAFLRVCEEKPEAIIDNASWLESFSKTAQDEDIQKLAGVFASRCLFDSHRRYLDRVLSYFRGDKDLALKQMESLFDLTNLTGAQWQNAARIFAKEKHYGQALRAYDKLAAGGHGATEKWRALGSMASILAEQEHMGDAVQAYARMYPVMADDAAIEAASAIAAKVNAGNFPAIVERAASLIQENPAHDRVSELYGFCSELAESLGIENPLPKTLADRNIEPSPSEAYESGLWDQLIETWELSGPYSGLEQFSIEAVLAPERDGESAEWKPVGERDSMGIVRFDRAFGLPLEKTSQSVGYAKATLVSPDERQALLALGSDDWVKVWMNGEEAHSYHGGRSLHPEQDRFLVNLKPGENKLMLKVGNNSGGWGFCVRIAEGGDGVAVKINR